jgi:prepilin-type N-terminal cleavage/methylation domain-containing protein
MLQRSQTTRRAFTLIELVVALVLVAVLAGLIIPRLVSTGDRKSRAEAASVAELVSVAARRAALSTQRIALDFDSELGLRVLALRARDPQSFAPGNVEWQPDVLAPPPSLSQVRVVSAISDGRALPAGRWRVEFAPGSRKPDLMVALEDDQGRAWTVVLPSEAQTAGLVSGSPRDVGVLSTSIDLDATGKADQPW